MPFETFAVMRGVIERAVGKKFTESLRPTEIKKIFAALGFENVSEAIAVRLSLLSEAPEGGTSHFQDAKAISEIIDELVPQELSDREVNDLRFASLVHDVGKTGPAEIDTTDLPEEEKAAMREAFVIFFNIRLTRENYPGVDPRLLPVKHVLLKELGFKRATAVWEQIQKATRLQVNPRPETTFDDSSVMYDVYGAHVYWTYDILRAQNVDPDIVIIASSHHILEGRNPAGIDLEELIPSAISLELADKYQAIRMRKLLVEEIADKYQALRVRGHLTHEAAIDILRQTIEKKLSSVSMRAGYSEVLDLLDKQKDLLESELDLSSEIKP